MSLTHQSRWARALAPFLIPVAALAACITLATWVTGGFRVQPFGLRVSSSGVLRPLALAVLAWCGALALSADRDRLQGRLERLVVPTAVAAVLAFATVHNAPYAAAADAYGYVAQAFDWRAGSLVHPEWAEAPPGFPAVATVPLGYITRMEPVPAAVPLYPPGLPLHMAVASLVGAWAVYAVSPVAAVALVFGTQALGRSWASARAGRAAALLIAFSPILVAHAIVPMSDTLAAAYWTWSLVWASSSRGAGQALAGMLAGVAIAVRPSLAPVIVALLACSAVAAGWRGVVAAIGGAVPFVAALGAQNAYLYGSPVATGYGDTSQLFAVSHILPNLRNYSLWLAQTSSPLPLVGAVLYAGRAAWTRCSRMPLVGFVVITTAVYLLYLPWPQWSFARFFLPALPLLFVMAFDVAEHVSARRAAWLFPVLVLVTLAWELQFTHQEHIQYARPAMARFKDVATGLAQAGLLDAPVVTRLHSGSLRHYAAARAAVRWDQISPEELRRGLREALAAGRRPLLIDDVDDRQAFESRFGPVACWADTSKILLEVREPAPVRVYAVRLGC